MAARDAMRDDLRAGWARTPTWLRVVGGVWIALSVALIVFLVVFDWNWARGPIGKIASAQLQRTVRIDGDLDVHPWSLKPRAEAAKIRISQPAWAGTGQMITVDRLAVQIELLPLFRRKVVLPLLQIDSPKIDLRRELSGRANWTFGDPNKKDKAPLKLPAIRHFVINDGAVRYEDRVRKMTFTGVVSSNEQASDGGRGKFQLARLREQTPKVRAGFDKVFVEFDRDEIPFTRGGEIARPIQHFGQGETTFRRRAAGGEGGAIRFGRGG